MTNTGNAALQNAVGTDDQEGPVCTIALIEAGETQQCAATGSAGTVAYRNVATVIASPIVNPTASVGDNDPSSDVVVAPTATPAPISVPPLSGSPTPTPSGIVLGFGPAIDIERATNGIDADLEPGVSLEANEPIVWTYVVTNTGSVDLYDVVVSDDLAGGICSAVTIPVFRQASCTLDGVAIEGKFGRIADVVAESISGQRVVDADATHHVVTDEVLGLVVTPTPMGGAASEGPVTTGPPVGAPSTVPDEVLAYTGGDADMQGLFGGLLIAAGFSVWAVSTQLRRRSADAHAPLERWPPR